MKKLSTFGLALCCAASSASAAPLNLVSSWNLLGNSVNIPITVATDFGNAANVTTVWKWVPATAKWAFYTPSMADGGAAYAASKGYDFLTVINGGEGFWVNAKAAFTAQQPAGAAFTTSSFQDPLNPPNPLAPGWSLIAVGGSPTPVAFNNGIGSTPPAVGAAIPANLTSLWAWDSALLNWYFYAPSLDANNTLATYITSKNYLGFGAKPLDPAMGFWVNRPAVAAPVITPINTAKNMFTSLRTSLIQLTNPARNGFFDTEFNTAKNDLRSGVVPSINKIRAKIDLVNSAITLMNDLKANGTTGYPACSQFMWGSCQNPDPVNVANTQLTFVTFNPKTFSQSTCKTSIPATFVAGILPAGINVSCSEAMIDNPSYTANGTVSRTYTANATAFSMYTFLANVTPAATPNTYNYTSTTQTDTNTFNAPGIFTPPPPTVTTLSAAYTGTALVTKNPAGRMNNTITVNGQLAADGVNHAYDQVSINSLRTYLPANIPVGAPAGFALASYNDTGSINSMLAGGATLSSITLLPGSAFTQLEDVNGNTATTPAARSLGKSLTVVVQAKTVNTQIDGTATASNFVTDLSGTASLESNFTFTGSMTNLANAAVGKFLTGTLTDIRDYSAYDATQPVSFFNFGNPNYIMETASFAGTVTNNTVAPSAIYQLSINEDKRVLNRRTLSFTYSDPAKNTVTVSAYNIDSAAPLTTYPINVSSGTVIGVLTKSPSLSGAKTSGLTGNLYIGGTPAAPGTLLGTLNGSTVNYTDGSFTSLQ